MPVKILLTEDLKLCKLILSCTYDYSSICRQAINKAIVYLRFIVKMLVVLKTLIAEKVVVTIEIKKDDYGSAPVPLYYRIREFLKDQIESGFLKTGDQIPTEEQLCDSFQVSRMTARRAVDELVREGRLNKRHGVGTFVLDRSIGRQLNRLNTLTDEFKQLGYKKLNSRMLSWRIHRALRTIAAILDIGVGDPVLRFKRVRYAEDVPIAVQTIYLPSQLASGLQDSDLEGHSLYKLVEQRFGKRAEWAKQQIYAIPATSLLAKYLEVDPGRPLFKVTRQAFFADGQPMLISRTYYRADRYSFQVNLYND